jgi:hypothetical protein
MSADAEAAAALGAEARDGDAAADPSAEGQAGLVSEAATYGQHDGRNISSGKSVVCKGTDQAQQPLPCLQALPLARIKRMVKADEEVKAVSNEAIFLIAKATVRCCAQVCAVSPITRTQPTLSTCLPPPPPHGTLCMCVGHTL